MEKMMKKLSDKQEIIRDTSFFSSSTYIARTMFFLRGFLNAKILGPGLYGLWSGLNIISNYASYSHLGCLNGMNREIPYQRGRHSIEDMKKIKDVAFTFCMLMNFIFSLILLIVAIVSWNKFSLAASIGLITIACFSFFYSIYEFYKTLLVATKKFSVISKANVIFPVIIASLTLILVPRFKIYGVYFVAILFPVLSLVYIWRKEPYKLKICLDFKEIFRLIKIGFPLVLINFLDETVMSVAIMTVLLLLGRVNLGYYSVAMLAAKFLIYLPETINTVFEPHVYQRYGETHDIEKLKRYLFKPTLIMGLLFPIILAVYYTGATFFIRHFMSKYTASIYPFSVIVVAIFFLSFSPTVFSFLVAINKQRFVVPIYLFGIMIVYVSSHVFIGMGFGITGVAFGFLLSSFFIGSTIFIYAIHYYIKNILESFLYLCSLWLPLLYMIALLYLGEIVIMSSTDLFMDALKLVVKLGSLFIFSLPLMYIANNKTGIVSEILRFLKLERFVFKKYRIDYVKTNHNF